MFSLTGQSHTGFIGWVQDYVLSPMGNLWFNRLDPTRGCHLSADQLRRLESSDRKQVADQIKAHAADITKPPLLVPFTDVNQSLTLFKGLS